MQVTYKNNTAKSRSGLVETQASVHMGSVGTRIIGVIWRIFGAGASNPKTSSRRGVSPMWRKDSKRHNALKQHYDVPSVPVIIALLLLMALLIPLHSVMGVFNANGRFD